MARRRNPLPAGYTRRFALDVQDLRYHAQSPTYTWPEAAREGLRPPRAREIEDWTRTTAVHPLVHPVENGRQDPYSVACVVDLLLQLDVSTTPQFPTAALMPLLRRNYAHIAWDPITVGRILGEIAEMAAVWDPQQPALDHIRVAANSLWDLRSDRHANQWFWRLRRFIQERCHQLEAWEHEHNRRAPWRAKSVWTDFIENLPIGAEECHPDPTLIE